MAESAPRTILITGASSGIGEALALHYAAPGVTLTLTGRDTERLAQVVAACRAKGAEAAGHIVAVTDAAAMAQLIEGCLPLDLVVANAGVSGNFKTWDDFDSHVRGIAAVNIDGVFNTVNPAAKLMVRQGRGQIAVVSSLASFVSLPGAAIYSASKAFARVYAESLRGQLASHGVRVSAVCPGFVVSRMTAKNRFPMPFLMDAARAARLTADGLACNRARIAFPWPMLALMRVLESLPYPLTEWLLRRAPAKD
jgi:short-subunit dehydrogenase